MMILTFIVLAFAASSQAIFDFSLLGKGNDQNVMNRFADDLIKLVQIEMKSPDPTLEPFTFQDKSDVLQTPFYLLNLTMSNGLLTNAISIYRSDNVDISRLSENKITIPLSFNQLDFQANYTVAYERQSAVLMTTGRIAGTIVGSQGEVLVGINREDNTLWSTLYMTKTTGRIYYYKQTLPNPSDWIVRNIIEAINLVSEDYGRFIQDKIISPQVVKFSDDLNTIFRQIAVGL